LIKDGVVERDHVWVVLSRLGNQNL